MVPHVIRLHSAWQADARAPSGRVQALARSFGRPTGLTAAERVWLALDPALLEAAVVCNGCGLRALDQAGAPLEFDVTDLLAERNELRLAADWLPTLPEVGRGISLPEGLVKLEIRSEAWIKGLSVTVADPNDQDATLRLGGEIEVLGAASSLALVATLQGRELLYQEVGGGAFQFDATASEIPRWNLGVRNVLVDLELRLVAAGHACWQARVPVAVRPGVERCAEGVFRVAGDKVAWPVDGQTLPARFEPAAFARSLAGVGLAAVPRILPLCFYRACDEQGVGVVQNTPPGTSLDALHQLFRHPSILACGDLLGPPGSLAGNRPARAGLQ